MWIIRPIEWMDNELPHRPPPDPDVRLPDDVRRKVQLAYQLIREQNERDKRQLHQVRLRVIQK